MTILGVAAGMDHAVAWVDTLVSDATTGNPTGHALKLAINPLARTVGVGAGMMAILDDAAAAVVGHDTIEAILPAVASALRASAMRAVDHRGSRQAAWFARNTYAVAGWSEEQGRVTAYEFPAEDLFEPRRIALLTCPAVDVPFYGQPLPIAAIDAAAGAQAAIHRGGGGEVGRLTLAVITEQGITAFAPREIIAPIAPALTPAAGCDAEPTPPFSGGEVGKAPNLRLVK